MTPANTQPRSIPQTYGDYLLWPDDERWEIIDGEAYSMSPSPATLHQQVSGDLFFQLKVFFRDKPCQVFSAPYDVILPDHDEADEQVRTVVQPDILVVGDLKKILKRCCRGAPDLLIEILSPSSASHDAIRKRVLYERHRVREYWLIDPANRLVTRHQLTTNDAFIVSAVYDDTGVIESELFPGLQVFLNKVFPPLPPRVVRESPAKFFNRD
jgi:Uma2 family endonuclease